MTAAELREAIGKLDISQVALSEELGVHVRSVNAWVQGRKGVPGYVAAYVRKSIRARELEASLAACWTLLENERRAAE
jgi:DNA-binding transcriptional regulator YiaG